MMAALIGETLKDSSLSESCKSTWRKWKAYNDQSLLKSDRIHFSADIFIVVRILILIGRA